MAPSNGLNFGFYQNLVKEKYGGESNWSVFYQKYVVSNFKIEVNFKQVS